LKQVIVVNENLNLPRGKLAAQVAHAAVASLLLADSKAQRAWLEVGMPKIVLACDSLAALQALEAKAQDAGLPCALIQDAGRTVLAPGTQTCLGIGPASAEALSAITGELKLVR